MWNQEDREQINRSRQLEMKCFGVNMSRMERMSFTVDSITADMHTAVFGVCVFKVFAYVGMCDAV